MKAKIFRVVGLVVLTLTMACTTTVQSPSEEIAELRVEAEQGNAFAQFILGNAYDKGEGVAQDRREAVRWFRKAAEQGDANAQYSLARIMHE